MISLSSIMTDMFIVFMELSVSYFIIGIFCSAGDQSQGVTPECLSGTWPLSDTTAQSSILKLATIVRCQ
jgi:hypothetical protein